MIIDVIKGDITEFKVDAIVNAANKSLLGGGGVDGAIHRAAGPELKEACRKLNGAETGEAKLTKGYNLPAPYVIHTVGPVYRDGEHEEADKLKQCYLNSLKVAEKHALTSIAFPAISTGIYGYPLEEASKIAIRTVKDMADKLESINKVTFVAFDDNTKQVLESLLDK